MTLSCAKDRQQNAPSFVIVPGYTTHYELSCDMSAQHSSEIMCAKISFSSKYSSIMTPVIHVILSCT